jgi:hypothetical protein
MRKIWLILAGLFVSAGTLVLLLFGNEIAPHLHKEVFKLLAQLIILAGICGLGSLVLSEISTSREHREVNRTLLRSTLNHLVGAYNEVKAVRRLLRADAVRPNYQDQHAYVLKEPYELLLRRLNDAQLELETQLRLVEGSKGQYPDSDTLCKLLSDAEEHIGDVISEWEERLGSFEAEPDKNRLVGFLVLRCFLASASRSFKPAFAIPMAQVFAILSTGIRESSFTRR